MIVCVIQPHYSFDENDLDSCFEGLLKLLDECDESMDLIVLPEYSDALADVKGKDGLYNAVEKYSSLLLDKARETAKRCNSMVFFNASSEGFKNTTYAVNRQSEIVEKYDKVHPTASEIWVRGWEAKYSFEFAEPYVIEIVGYKFVFLTCYDFYFYEIYDNIARCNVDFVIGCSHQRSDTHDAEILEYLS
jgi:predicted amidohydrolase